jgi:hypothetical protein
VLLQLLLLLQGQRGLHCVGRLLQQQQQARRQQAQGLWQMLGAVTVMKIVMMLMKQQSPAWMTT